MVINNTSVNTSQVGSYNVEYRATDTYNSIITATRVVLVKDRTPPIISISGENPKIVLLDTSYNDAGATSIDSSSVNISYNNVNTQVIGDYVVLYTTTDLCGNVATASRNVFVRDPNNMVITNSGETGAVGDPYVTTIYGDIYKIDNISGNIRLLQGYYDNKLFTFNAELALLNDNEFNKLLKWRKNKLKNRSFSDNFLYEEKPAYFSKFYISWGNEYFILDSKKLKILESNYKKKYTKDKLQSKEYPWSNKYSKTKRLLVNFNDILITFKSYKNKDINNGFSINNATLLKNRSGILEHTLHSNDALLDNIKNIEPLKRKKNRKHKKYVKEEFLENGSERKTIKFKVY